MEKVLFVINPASGGINKHEVVDLIRSQFNKDGYTIYQTTGRNDQQEIEKILKNGEYQKIIAGGGDGTVSLVARIISDQDITLGIFPLGSANGTALELGLPTDPVDALEIIAKGCALPFDVVKINDHMMLHLADFGTNATLVKRYNHDDHRGFFGYALSAIKELPNLLVPGEFELTIDGKEMLMESSFVVIANARQYGTGVIVNPDGKTDDGKFEICCLEGTSFDEFLEKFSRREGLGLPPFKTFSTDRASIRLKKRTDFQIDGEYLGKVNKLDIQVLPGKLRIIR